MREPISPHTADGASAQSLHRFLQMRSHGSKSAEHRYERRKVRAYLRRVGLAADEEANATLP